MASYKDYTYITNPESLKNTKDYGKFSYDPLQDANYKSLAKMYDYNGSKAAQDTLGQVSALNGGYGSSYALSAAQQTRNDYNQQLASLIPDLENNAYNRWNNDRQFDSQQWYQNMGLYLDAIGTNNSAVANNNADKLNRDQFAWQKKKGSGGGGGGSSSSRSVSSYYKPTASSSKSKSTAPKLPAKYYTFPGAKKVYLTYDSAKKAAKSKGVSLSKVVEKRTQKK